MPKKKYTPEDDLKAVKALEENQGSLYKASAQTGLPMNSVKHMAQRAERKQGRVSASLRKYTREYHRNLLEDRSIRILEAMKPAGEPKAIFHQSYAHRNVFADLQLIQGLPTEVHGHLVEGRLELIHMVQQLANLMPSLPQDVVDVEVQEIAPNPESMESRG